MGPSWVDSHCHLQLIPEESDLVLSRAPHVSWLVVPGVDAATSRAALDLAEKHPGRVLAAVGLHPDNATRWPQERDRIAELVPRAIAVGESGLDFYRNRSPRLSQIKAFQELLGMAVQFNKPVIVHCRDAFEQVHRILEQTGTGQRAIMHCWSGGPHWARRFLDLGVTFSFSCPVISGIDDMIRRGVALMPPGRAMVETDAPHLCSSDNPKRACDPSEIGLVGATLALVWHMTCNEVAQTTTATALRVFPH
ncbi:MAG: TatD family hydrolase [Acidimicrobiia bacterium]